MLGRGSSAYAEELSFFLAEARPFVDDLGPGGPELLLAPITTRALADGEARRVEALPRPATRLPNPAQPTPPLRLNQPKSATSKES
jgi:hypothetical protein